MSIFQCSWKDLFLMRLSFTDENNMLPCVLLLCRVDRH